MFWRKKKEKEEKFLTTSEKLESICWTFRNYIAWTSNDSITICGMNIRISTKGINFIINQTTVLGYKESKRDPWNWGLERYAILTDEELLEMLTKSEPFVKEECKRLRDISLENEKKEIDNTRFAASETVRCLTERSEE